MPQVEATYPKDMVSFAELQPTPRFRDRFQRILPQRLRRSPDYLSLLSPDPLASVNFQDARQLLDTNGTVYAMNGTKHLAREYWSQKADMPDSDIQKLVDSKSRLIFHIPSKIVRNIIRLSAGNPLAGGLELIDQLAPLYDTNGFSLDASIRGTTEDGKPKGIDGFNDHRRPHIRTVLRGALALLDQAQTIGFRSDITPEIKQTTALGTAIHDTINVFSRKHHAVGIPVILPHIMPELARSPLWHDVAQIGVLHNEAQVMEFLKTLPEEHTLADEIAKLEELGPATLAGILADKLHIGQDRLPERWKDADGILRDPNIGINACFSVASAKANDETSGAGYTRDGTKFIVNMLYNPGMEKDYFHPAITPSRRYTNGRFAMPQAIDNLLRTQGVSHSEVLEAMLWETYQDRLKLTIMAAFAFNPTAQTVEIHIHDIDANNGLRDILPPERIAEIKHRTRTFTRGNLDDELNTLRKSFEGKGIEIPKLQKAGEALLPATPNNPEETVLSKLS